MVDDHRSLILNDWLVFSKGVESVVLWRYAHGYAELHKIGLYLEEQARGRKPHSRYEGFASSLVSCIRQNCRYDGHAFDVWHAPEHGNLWHAEIGYVDNFGRTGAEAKPKKPNAKTFLKKELRKCFETRIVWREEIETYLMWR